MNGIKVSLNHNGLLFKKYLPDTIDFNKHVYDIVIFKYDMWRKYAGDIVQLFKITTFLLTNEKAKSTFTIRLLPLNFPLM